MEIRAFSETRRIQDVLARAKKPGEAVLKVDVNVYGALDDAAVVGDRLCAAKLFLQDPEHGVQNIEYSNPHLILFPGFEEPSVDGAEGRLPNKVPDTSKGVRSEQDVFHHTLTTIYHSLRRFRNLDRVQCGALVLTPLLPVRGLFPNCHLQ